MRMSVLSLPLILVLSLLIQIPGASSAWADGSSTATSPSPAPDTPQLTARPRAEKVQTPAQAKQQVAPRFLGTEPDFSSPSSRTSPPSPQQNQTQQSPPPTTRSLPPTLSQQQRAQMLRPISFDYRRPTPLPPTAEPKKKSKEPDPAKEAKKTRKANQRRAGGEGLAYFYGGPIRKFNLNFPPGALEALRAKPITEQWAPCTVEIDYETSSVSRYEGCGCRYKGSVGSLRMCIDPTTGQPNGACRKMSWKIDSTRFVTPGVDGERSMQRFKGIKELAFGGLPVDLSLLTEKLAAGLLKSSGIIGFRANYALLYINGKPDGIYSLPELPSDLFTEDRWGWDEENGDGALYKEALFRNSSDEDYFKQHRVSGANEDSWMVEVNHAILNAKTDAQKKHVLDTYFDVKSFIDVTAFNTVLGNTDDWRQRHNFLWYVLTTKGSDTKQPTPSGSTKKPKKAPPVKKLILIPSDYDRINDDNSQRTKGPKYWYSPIPANQCTQVDQTPEQRAASQPANQREFWISLFSQYPPNVGKPINCDQFDQVFAILAKQVNQRIVDLATGTMSAANVDALMATYSAQIQRWPGQDPDPPNQQEWAEGKSSLRDYLNNARSKALADARAELGTSAPPPSLPTVASYALATNNNPSTPATTYVPAPTNSAVTTGLSLNIALPTTPQSPSFATPPPTPNIPAAVQKLFPPVPAVSWASASLTSQQGALPSPSFAGGYQPKEAPPPQQISMAKSFQSSQRLPSDDYDSSQSDFPLFSPPSGRSGPGGLGGLDSLSLLLGASSSKSKTGGTTSSGPSISSRSLSLPSSGSGSSGGPPSSTNWSPGAILGLFQPKSGR